MRQGCRRGTRQRLGGEHWGRGARSGWERGWLWKRTVAEVSGGVRQDATACASSWQLKGSDSRERRPTCCQPGGRQLKQFAESVMRATKPRPPERKELPSPGRPGGPA